MTTENPNKIDMNRDRTQEEWKNLLSSVKDNIAKTLTPEEQSYYILNIQAKISGVKCIRYETVLADMMASAADIDDIVGGY